MHTKKSWWVIYIAAPPEGDSTYFGRLCNLVGAAGGESVSLSSNKYSLYVRFLAESSVYEQILELLKPTHYLKGGRHE